MNRTDAERRLRDLRADISRHDHAYHVLARPEIPDAAYDRLYDELLRLEADFPDLVTDDSPSRRVGGEPLSGFVHVRHDIPMLSLEKARTDRELDLFDARVRKTLGADAPAYHVEPKIDGVSLALHYRNGALERAATRGDGSVGDDITANVRTIRCIPLRLRTPHPPAFLEIRGEAFIARDDFARMNEAQIRAGEDPFPNPRNATAGSLKQLDPRVVARRPISAVFYAAGRADGIRFATQAEALEYFRRAGLPVPRMTFVCASMAEALERCREIKTREAELPCPIDGAVVKVNRLDQRDLLGLKSKHPAYAIAYKPKEWIEQTQTRLLDIAVQVGRSGVLTPVAELEPVFLDGSTISRATLHNLDEIRRKDIRIGDAVVVEKAGMVIPAVIRPLPELRSGAERAFDMPDRCPACGGPVARGRLASGDGEEVALRCDNLQCPAQKARRMEYFCRRAALDIETIGGVVADALVARGLAADPFDLFSLDAETLGALNLGTDGNPRVFGPKNAAKAIEAVNRSRNAPLFRWLFALGIPGVGEMTARAIAGVHAGLESVADSDILRAIVKIDALKAERERINPQSRLRKPSSEKERLAREARMAEIGGELRTAQASLGDADVAAIDPIPARSTLEFFASARGREILATMRRLGIRPAADAAPRGREGPFTGGVYVLTGTLRSMSREAAAEAIRARGGSVTGTVSGKTTALIAGEAPGEAKTRKAESLGIPAIGEPDFLTMLGAPVGARKTKPDGRPLLPL